MIKTRTRFVLGIFALLLTVPQKAAMSGLPTQEIAKASHEHMVVNCVQVSPEEQRPEFGCFILATAKGLQFKEPTVYWHLRAFPNLAAAQAFHRPYAPRP